MSSSMSAQLKTGTHITQQYIARHMLEWASAALIYLGILTFTAVTLIGCMIWLLIS
jgi:hypothetical protein